MNGAAGEQGSTSGVVPPHLPGHRFVELIDSGGFAQVFRYRRELLDWDVAVKVLREGHHSGLPGMDFINEARIMAELAWHPNIMTIHDHGTVADGRPYLVMDYCAPPNLKERSRGGQMPVQEVLEVGILVAGAVETAHRAGYLHRDIKPANILVNAGGEPVLADFGISSAILVPETERDALSLPWAALEVIRGDRAGPAADVHSLGATIYTLLAGRAPFHREGASNAWHDMLLRLQSSGPEPIGRADLPPGLEDLLRRSMSADPAQRPSSALQFAHQLAGFGPAAWRAPEPRLGRRSTPMIRQFTPEDVGGAPGSGGAGEVGGRGGSAGRGGGGEDGPSVGRGFEGGQGAESGRGADRGREFAGQSGPAGIPGAESRPGVGIGTDAKPGSGAGGGPGVEDSEATVRRGSGEGGSGGPGDWGRSASRPTLREPDGVEEGLFGPVRSEFGGEADTLVRSPRRGGSRSKMSRGFVAGVALAAAVAALLIFRPWGSDGAPCQDPGDFDPSCAAESVEEPGVPESAIDPARLDPPSSLTWERRAKDAVLSWEVKDAQVGDRYQWWVEGEGLSQEQHDTEATSVAVSGAGEKAVCAVVQVSRQGRTSEASRRCFEAGR